MKITYALLNNLVDNISAYMGSYGADVKASSLILKRLVEVRASFMWDKEHLSKSDRVFVEDTIRYLNNHTLTGYEYKF